MVPAGMRDVLVFDDGHKDAVPGFGIRKFKSGKASYIVKYSVGGKQRRQALGPVTRGNLKAMRVLASEVKARARLGQDLIAEKQAAKNKLSALTLGQIVPKYLAVKESEMKPRSYAEVERHINVAWKPLHKRSIGDITRTDVVAVIDDLERGSGKVAADRARTSLSTLFAWAIDRGYCDANPTNDIRSRAQEVSRTRVLSEAELVEVWKACLDDDYGRIVRLLILTGQRKTEVGDLALVGDQSGRQPNRTTQDPHQEQPRSRRSLKSRGVGGACRHQAAQGSRASLWASGWGLQRMVEGQIRARCAHCRRS